MPDIGLFELLVIGILLFVVVGPERMPEFFGQLGRWARFARNWWTQMRAEIGRETAQHGAPLQDAAVEMQAHMQAAKEEIERAVDEAGEGSGRQAGGRADDDKPGL